MGKFSKGETARIGAMGKSPKGETTRIGAMGKSPWQENSKRRVIIEIICNKS